MNLSPYRTDREKSRFIVVLPISLCYDYGDVTYRGVYLVECNEVISSYTYCSIRIYYILEQL